MPRAVSRARRAWRTWWQLSGSDRRLSAAALGLLPTCAVALRLVGLRRLYAWLSGSLPIDPLPNPAPPPDRVVAAVERAAVRLPIGTTCLVRSLVTWYLLARRGWQPSLLIGVRRPGPTLEAHAWVEVDGRPVNDSPDVRQRFVAFDSPIVATPWP